MKKLLFLILINIGFSSFAQNKTFDIVNFTPPKGWTENLGGGNISYSRIDGGSWAQIAIYQHNTSSGNIQTDFDKEWNELIASGKTISSPEKTKPETSDSWTVMSGSGIWQYNGANVASILTVYSNKNVCISVLCNTTAQPYLKDYQSLIGSLDIDAGKANNSSNQANSNSNNNSNNSSIVGMWVFYTTESNGMYNGFPQLTGGYMRREYVFNNDGTYVFRAKDWMVNVKDILFVYETGTYSISGNQLTIKPQKGKGEWWGKVFTNTKAWGKLVEASKNYKLENTTYTFDFRQYGGENTLILKSAKPTARDGKDNDKPGAQQEYRYSTRDINKSLIDNPPGFRK